MTVRRTPYGWEGWSTATVDGRRVRRHIRGRTRAEVTAAVRAADDLLRVGALADGGQVTVSEWLDSWIAGRGSSVRPRTIIGYLADQVHIDAAIGRVQLARLSPEQVESLYAAMASRGLAAGSILHARRTLSAALGTAVARGRIGRNVVRLAAAPRDDPPEIEPLTVAEAQAVMRAALRTAWETEHGPGSVIGLAPPAAAAQVLADDLNIGTENTARWLTEARRNPDMAATIADLQHKLAAAGHPGTRRHLRDRIARLRAESARWQVRGGQLVIVDEASLAGTFALDELISQAGHAGGKVVLVGDWAQLSAVQAGGAFGMLVADRDLAPELTDVRRFLNGWEKAASVRLRIGDPDAIDVYMTHDRVQSGSRDEVLDALYAGWKRDVDAGRTSLMIAGDADTVAELNRRARADRIAAGQVTEAGLGVIAGVAGVGDLVVTRRNDRTLTTGRSWVKNGDRWTVANAHADGSMTVQRATGGGRGVLPADYVREHVELGYACTAHRAQGRTVDTAHAAVSVTTTREVLYVAATRGRTCNRLYVDTYYDPDLETSHVPIEPRPPEEILARVLGNVGADVAAHSVAHREREHTESIATLAGEYLTIAREAQTVRWDALIRRSGLTTSQLEAVTQSPAYGPLLAALRTAESRGLNVDATLPTLVTARGLGDAGDVAAVLHERVDRWAASVGTGGRVRDRSIVGLIARADGVTDPDMRRALDERAHAMERRAAVLVDRALAARQPWTTALGEPPVEPSSAAAWAREARTVAAFRELHNVTGPVPATLRDGNGSAKGLGEARAATAAWHRAEAVAERDRCRATRAPSAPASEAGVAPAMEV